MLLSHADFVMANHHVHDTSVLPGAIFLDLLWRLARARGIDGCIQLNDIVFEEPVVTDQRCDRRLRLGLTRRHGDFDVLVTSVPVRGNDISGTVRRHMTATMRILAEVPAGASPPDDLGGMPFKNMADLYAQARSEHIVHGMPMRVSGELLDTGAGLIADIALDPAHPTPSGFHLHPALLDASTLIAFARTPKLEYPYIPITIAAATLVAPLAEPRCRVWVPAEEVHASTADVMHNSYEILDAAGGLVARIERLTCKRIRHPLLISGLTGDDIDGRQEVSVASPSASPPPPPPSRADSAASIRGCVRAEIAARLGVPVESVDTGAGFYALGLDSVALLGLSAIIGEKLGIRLYPTVLFEFGTVDDLAEHLASEYRPDRRDFEVAAEVQVRTTYSKPPEVQAWQPCWVDLDDKAARPAAGRNMIGLVTADPVPRLREALELAGWSVTEHSAVPQAPDPAIDWCVVAGADQLAAVEAYQDLVRELGRRAAQPSGAVLLGIEDDPSPELLGTGAFCRTATAEVRTLSAAVIAADTATEISAVVAGLTTVLGTKKSGLFRLRQGILQALDYRPADFAAESPLLRPGGRYLITGGAGGLGTHLAEHLITTHAAAVHLVGRGSLDPAVDAQHAKWRSSGATVTYTQCDVADGKACLAMVAALTREHGPIDGVFHLAGVLDDSVFITGSTQRTRAVLEPKLAGAQKLWQAVDRADLDFFVSFTSISGALANPGQSAYAYANSSLDFWSLARHDTSCEVMTIAWPYWADGGMRSGRSGNGDEAADLPTDLGLRLLEKLLRRSDTRHLCATYGDPDEARAAMVTYPDARPQPWTARPAERVHGRDASDNSIGATEPIAIIGLAGSYPGAADPRAFWQMLQAGEDAIVEIPDDTWPEALAYSADSARGRSYSRWGGLLSERDHFAPAYFGISRREAESMDPQERQFLMTAWRALEDAARPPESLRDETVGVFCGVMWNHYQLYRDADGVAPSALHSTIPNRVSYTFDFSGPSLALDTACSSSLVAVHLAVQSLRSGESTMALAGGVNITTHPHKYVQLSADSFLSRTGKCRTFGAGADGYVPGDGVGVVVLKPLRRAVADGDIVHAVLRGTSMNHNGRSAGFTVPDPAAQAALIAAALSAADVKPAEVGYLEAHGTGTALGDPIEATAIQRELSSGRPDTQHLYVGSVKTNIGHLESAAGIAGLTKAVLQIEHGRIVPTLHSGQLNAAVVEAAPSLEFPQSAVPWPSGYASRIAGVSAFGAGGTNVHVIVEGAPERSTSQLERATNGEVAVLLSADSTASLRTYATDLRRWLHSEEAVAEGAVDMAVLERAAAVLGVPGHEIDVDWALADLGFDPTMLEAVVGPRSFERGEDLSTLTLRALMTSHTSDPLLYDIAYTLRVGRRPRKVRLAVTCATLDQLAAALEAYAGGQDDGPHHHSGAATNAVDGVERTGEARDVARAWCAGIPLDPVQAPAGRRLSLPMAPLETEICRLGGWRNRNSPPDHPRSAATEGQVSVVPKSPESGSGHCFSLLPDGIALLRLDSPETHNMLTDELLALLGTALERVHTDDAVRVFVICGNGAEFCLGGTLEAVSDVATQRTTFADAAVIYEGLATCRKPVVTALAGNAFGGGLAFGLYGDLVVMSRDAYYSANFLRYGITPGMGATYILEKRMGGPLSQEMLMSGREYSGRELERRGASVNFCDADQVVAEAMSLARTVAGHPPAAVQQLKAHLSSGSRQDLPATIAAEMDMHRRLSVQAAEVPAPAEQSYPRAADRAAVPDLAEAIVASVADILFAEPDEIDSRVSFRDQGLDSVGAVQLVRDLNERFKTDLESTVVYEHPTVEELADYLASEVEATAFLADAARATPPAPEAARVTPPAPEAAWATVPVPEPARAIPFVPDAARATAPVPDGVRATPPAPEAALVTPPAPEAAWATVPDVARASLSAPDAAARATPPAPEAAWATVPVPDPARATPFARGPARTAAPVPDPARATAPVPDVARATPFATDAGRASLSAPDAVRATLPSPEAARATAPASAAVRATLPVPDVARVTEPSPGASVVGRIADPSVGPEPAGAKHSVPGAVAVVGMAGRWPDADDIEQFARNIAAGRSSITDVSSGRWDLSALYAPGRHEGKTTSRWAALLDDVESFDHAFFNLSPLDVAAMDCQQRLFLTESWKALEAAGHLSNARGRGCTGIYVGCAPGDHSERLRSGDKHETAQAFLGSSASILAARIAYFLNLRGPTIAVDTACSSSLVAVHLACQALLTGEVDTAVAGGVAVMETPSLQVRSSQVGMLSPTGTSAPFDAAADGIVLGEGVGVVVLRRLSDALRDGDQVLAVLRSTGVNGDGHTNGITAPNAAAQAELTTRTLQRAGLTPSDVSFVETHGTGTSLGDPIEISGLIQSLAADQPAWLGSVKANIGHTTTAAGISSLIKTIVCMQMEIVAPLVNHGVRNPAISDLGRFHIPTRKQPWPFRPAVPRTAVVASYGFSGTNSVAIVQDVAPSLPWRTDAATEIERPANHKNASRIPISADDPIVAEHVVVGQRLLPAAATVEFTRTLLSGQADAAFSLHGVRWRAPVIVDDNSVVTVTATPLEGDTDSANRSIAIGSDAETVAVTASLELPGQSQDRPQTLDIAGLSARCQRSVLADRLYTDFADAGLAYGPRYRRLTKVLVGEDLVVGTLNPAAPGFGAETAMIDAALQSLGALPGLGDGSALVPVAAQRISLWGAATRATTVVGERTGTTYRVVLTDSKGMPLVEFEGLRLYPMSIEPVPQPIPAAQHSTPGLVYTLVWVPLGESPRGSAEDGEVLVVADRSRYELGAALLQDAGGKATLVPLEQPSPGALTPSVRSVVVLPGSAHATTLLDTLSLLRSWYGVLRDEFGSDPLRLSLITRQGVHIGEHEVPDALNSAVHGFAGAVAAEQPTWAVRCVDVVNDDVDLDEVRDAMLVEAPNDSSHRVLALRDGRLLRRVFRSASGDGVQRLELGRRLVVIGATGAIGRAICAAAEGPCTQVWIGRSSAAQVGHHLESAGGAVHYLQADVGDAASIGNALREAERLLGTIDAVVHCAGELRDRRIADLTDEDFEAVLRPRVDGMRNLLAHTFTHSDPKFLVASSAAAFVDSGGQANYAAGCCALDAVAVAARSRGRDVTVVNWGYWDGDGVASTSYHRKLMAADGIVPLAADQAMSALADVLAAGHGQALVLAANTKGLSHFGIQATAKPLRSSETGATQADRGDAGPVQQARNCIRRAFCEVLGFGEDELSLDATFETYGVSSVVGVQLLERLERDIGPLPPTLLYEEQTIRALADRIAGEYPSKLALSDPLLSASSIGEQEVSQPAAATDARSESRGRSSSEDVAVIGLAGRYPGAPDIAALWQNLLAGICSLTEVPAERWHWRQHPDPRRGLQPYQAWGGFLTDPYCFDAALFGVLPKVAEDIDPQERIFLETTWDLLERTGYLNDDSQAAATGVFVGVMYGGYGEVGARLAEQGTPNGAHTAYWSIANRISYTLNLSGPSVAVDTACSSSLTAVHLAIQSLHNGECDIAVAGGVNLIAHPSHMMSLGERNMLAADGRVKVFDDAADGYVPGEGVGALLLKPLDAALRDGDDIWAVIKGTAVNAGGHTSGFTVPNPQAQAAVITSAVQKARVAPESISYVEAHGSGTALGDPIEISALGTAFRKLGSESAPAWVGSVKSNIGHLEGAAGIAGLTKTVLQLRHRTLAPMVNLDTVNPRIPFAEVGTQPVRSSIGWRPGLDGQPLRAGVSSFGAGGTNVHVVVEEAPPRRELDAVDGPFLVLLSCPDMARLREYASDIADFAQSLSLSGVARMAWTSQTGRRSFGYRLAVLCSSGDELARQLHEFAAAAEAGTDTRIGRGIFAGTPSTRRAASEDAVDDEALRRRDLERLAQLWVDGARIAWKQLWHKRPGKLAYPGVPLRRNFYSVPNPARESVAEFSAPASDSGSPTQLHYEVPTWQPSPLGGSRRAVESLGVLVLTEGDRPLAAELIDEARRRGIRAYSLDAATAAPESVDALVLLVDPRLLDPAMLAGTIIRVAVEQTPTGRSRPPKLLCAWQTATHPVGPATAGLLRSLCAERQLSASAVDLGAMDLPAAASTLLDEVGRDESAEVRYRGGHASSREVATMVEVDLLPGAPWSAGPGSYVISGGGGKLGIATAAWLADSGAGTVWLLGRSAAGPEVRTLTGRYGAERIRFRQGDVTDADAVGRVLDEARSAGPLRGVVHAAGLLRDAPAAGKTASDIARVLAPKVNGMQVLDAATAQDRLEFFVAYSSLVSRNGSPGQADYSFANAYLDAACLHREELRRTGQRSGKTVSIGWPLWAAGGMRMPTAVTERLRRLHGMVPMSTAAGFEALAQALRAEYPVVQVTELETQRSIPPTVPDQPAPQVVGQDEHVLAEVRRHAAEFLLVPASEVDLDAELLELGFDSISLTELVERLNGAFGTSVRPTAVFDNPTLLRLATHFAEPAGTQPAHAPSESAATQPAHTPSDSAFRGAAAVQPSRAPGDRDSLQDVAVIGMAATIASADSSAQLWESLIAGHDLVRSVPMGRPELRDDPAMAGIRGGFVSSAAAFDADFFGIAPREAAVMDPQQRLFLTVCWEAIWDAALAPEDLRGSATAVFAAVSTMDYQDLMSARGVPDRAHSATGLSHAILANRVSHLLDLHGPSEAIDTACSSSLVAVHRAIRALRSGECTQALVGGVNLTLTAGLYRAFTDAGMLSAQGRCATFDSGADGYVRGEGAGALLLKPLSDALRDGDRVHAVIRGSAVNHTGRTASLTAPAPQSQGAVIRAAYRDAGTELSSLDYIETHGTGTRLGDPVEIDGIKQALGTEVGGRVLLGSIKASVGHLEAAAGMAGLVKTVQILRHRKVPGQLHLHTLNPQIELAGTDLHIPTVSVDLPADREIVAGVSSFGFGGTNAHVVLASAPWVAPTAGNPLREHAIPLAAKDEHRLAAYARALAAGVTDGESVERVAATLQRRHRGGRVRAVLTCRDIGDFRAAAGALGAGQPHERCLRGPRQGGSDVESRWLAGQSVDWTVIAPLTSLPTPPFMPVRHWFEADESEVPPDAVVDEMSWPSADPEESGPLTTPSVDLRVPTSSLGPGMVRDEVAAILGVAVGALDTSRTWRDLGLDSIFAVDLAERLTAKLGFDVTATGVVESATVDGLEAHIAAQVDGLGTDSDHSLQEEIDLFLGQLTGSPVTAPVDFDTVGLSSIDRLRAVGCLESYFGPLPNTLLYDYPSTTSLTEFLCQTFSADVVSGFTAASVTYSADLAPVPAAGEVTEMFGGRMIRRADLPLHEKLAVAVTELSKTYRLEDALAGRDIAPFIYLPDHEKWYLDVGWVGEVVLVWGYTGPADSAIDAVADFGEVASTAGARLSVLWPVPLDTVHDRQFHATPFGVMQEIGDIASFTVAGGEKRRLRGIIGKFQRAGQVRVEEYQVGEVRGYDRDIVRLIDAWSDGKQNVNPYVGTIRAEVARGELPPGHRVFLTFVDDVVVAVVVISRLGVQNGYLLDVEFYDAETPTGCLEYAVTEIIDRLRAEDVEIFSLGAIFGVPVGNSANADPVLVDELVGMGDAGLTPLGNYHFKRKFKPSESTIYLCQPHGERSSIAEILLLIGDPELEPTGSSSATSTTEGGGTAGGSVVADRFAGTRGNVLQLDPVDIHLDLISDSWADHDDHIVRTRLSELLAAERAVPRWLPFEEVVLAPSGREAESLLCRAWPGPRGTVLHNGVFPTWLGSLAENRFTPKALDAIGADGLATAVERGLAGLSGAPSFVLIELCPNSAGGVPIPDRQLARIRAACDRVGTPLVLDATRVVDNVIAPGLASAALAGALEAVLAHADTITMSLSKNFALTAGGLVATSDGALIKGLRSRTVDGKGEFSALGRAVMRAGLADLATAHRLVVERQAVVAEFARVIQSYGVPTAPTEPTFAICVPSTGPDEDAAMELAGYLHQQTGVRVGPHLASPVHPGLDGHVRVAIPIGYADQVRAKMSVVAAALGQRHEQRTVRGTGEEAPWFASQLGQLRETYLTHLSDSSEHETTVPGNLRVLQRVCPSVRSTLIEDEEGQVELFEAGTGELPLVLMHPFNIGAGMFAYQFGRLAQNRRIVVIHQPGVGRTRTTSSLTLDGLVDLQIRVLDRIGVRGRFHVGGASVGSIFAQWMALAHPDRVASLSLLGGSYKFANRKGRIDKLDQVIADDFDSIEAGGVALGGDVRRAVTDLLMESESMDPRTGLRYLDLFAKGSDLTDKLSSVSVPALIVQGRHDSVVGVATGQFIHRRIADSEYAELPNSGHFVCFTEPDRVCDLVAEFIARHEGERGQ